MIIDWRRNAYIETGYDLAAVGSSSAGLSITFAGFTQSGFGSLTVVTTYDPSGGGGGGQHGPPGAPIAIKVYIAGVDRTAYVARSIRRSWQLGSICTCSFLIDSAMAGTYRPDEWDQVIIMLGAYRFFSGVVGPYKEKWRGGGATFEISVNCFGWTALLERRYLGIDVIDATGATTAPIPPITITRQPGDMAGYWYAQPLALGATLPQQPSTLAQLLAFIQSFLTDAGLTFHMNANTDGPLSEQTLNWLSISQILRALESQFGVLFMLDMYKTIQVLNLDDGRGPALEDITDANGPDTAAGSVPLWQQIEIERGGLYRNRQGERTSQQLNAAFQVSDPNAIITNHSSRLSYVAWADDAVEQARIGFTVETIDDGKDVQDKAILQAMADSDLVQGALTLVKVTIETTYDQFEPGQLLTINTTIPPLSTTLLIEQVDSELSGPTGGPISDGTLLSRHVVQASNSRFRRGAGLAHEQRLNQAANVPPIPLVGWGFWFTQAETIEGLTNAGLTAGVKPLTQTAARKGIAAWCDWRCAVAPTNDVILDILAGGVSLFAPGRRPVIRSGQTFMENTNYAFVVDPLKVPAGVIFEQQVITADTAFRDGVFTMMFAG